jgi:hypothetical protein
LAPLLQVSEGLKSTLFDTWLYMSFYCLVLLVPTKAFLFTT